VNRSFAAQARDRQVELGLGPDLRLDEEPIECECRELIEQHSGKYLVCPDGIHEFTPRRRCAACEEWLREDDERAETARGIIHQACMLEGETIA
jgi:hypothetical protein